jgi:hypothetical protein
MLPITVWVIAVAISLTERQFMSVVIDPSRCHLSEEELRDRDDPSVVHVKDEDNPGWTMCGLLDEEPECCGWGGEWDGNQVCTRCNRRICPSCLEICVAWFSLGRH